MYKLLKISVGQMIVATTFFINIAHSATVTANVQDNDGNPVEFAVITLIGENSDPQTSSKKMPSPIMNQQNIEFSPFVLPVSVGTTVSFPNRDNVRHHVYSFSKVKRFELELYGGDEEKSVFFDNEGVVALGCNIHDDMLAYIYVTPSNNFDTSDADGNLTITDLKAGSYQAYVWHPRISGNLQDYIKNITVNIDSSANLNFEISLKRERKRRKKGNY